MIICVFGDHFKWAIYWYVAFRLLVWRLSLVEQKLAKVLLGLHRS